MHKREDPSHSTETGDYCPRTDWAPRQQRVREGNGEKGGDARYYTRYDTQAK